jgi:hypothetical protein
MKNWKIAQSSFLMLFFKKWEQLIFWLSEVIITNKKSKCFSALQHLTQANYLGPKGSDGPSEGFIKFIWEHNGKAPEYWKGFRRFHWDWLLLWFFINLPNRSKLQFEMSLLILPIVIW